MLCSPGFFRLWGKSSPGHSLGHRRIPPPCLGTSHLPHCLPQAHWPGHCTAREAGTETKRSLVGEEPDPAQPLHEVHWRESRPQAAQAGGTRAAGVAERLTPGAPKFPTTTESFAPWEGLSLLSPAGPPHTIHLPSTPPSPQESVPVLDTGIPG